MAVLQIEALSLEIAYRDVEDGCVAYDIWLRWRDEPILNDNILKRRNEYWRKRGFGAVYASEHGGCGVLPLLRHVFETNSPGYWEPTDPDVLLAIYPEGGFPFLPPNWRPARDKPDARTVQKARERETAIEGARPDQLIELILFVDVYTFEDAYMYYGDGVCFRLSPRRDQLEELYKSLRAEYVDFKQKYRIDAYNRESLGPDFTEDRF